LKGARPNLKPGDVVFFTLGLCFGSFVATLSFRLPIHESLTGRSHCPRCGAKLGPSELIPVISFLIQKGKCRHCGYRISPAYPVLEIGTAIALLVFRRTFGVNPIGILNLVVALQFITLAGTDWFYSILPNKILVPLSVSVLLLKIVLGKKALIDAVTGGILGFLFLYAVILFRPDAIGAGDVKMSGVVGMYLGATNVFLGLGLAFVLASIYVLPFLLLGKKKPTDSIPLGVFLSTATLIAVVWTA